MGRPLSLGADGRFGFGYVGNEDLYLELLNEERDRAQTALAERAQALAGRAQPVQTAIRDGDAANEILAAAKDFAADLIVVGSRGYTGVTRFFAGSVARQVVLDATCSVLIVRGSAVLNPAREPRLLLAGLTVA